MYVYTHTIYIYIQILSQLKYLTEVININGLQSREFPYSTLHDQQLSARKCGRCGSRTNPEFRWIAGDNHKGHHLAHQCHVWHIYLGLSWVISAHWRSNPAIWSVQSPNFWASWWFDMSPCQKLSGLSGTWNKSIKKKKNNTQNHCVRLSNPWCWLGKSPFFNGLKMHHDFVRCTPEPPSQLGSESK